MLKKGLSVIMILLLLMGAVTALPVFAATTEANDAFTETQLQIIIVMDSDSPCNIPMFEL